MSDKRVTMTAPCKYCGQNFILSMPEDATKEEIETAAFSTCKCQEGEAARNKIFNKNNADAWIDDKYKNEEGMRMLLHECVDAVTWETVEQISVKRNDFLDAYTVKTTTLTMKRDALGQLVIGQNTTSKIKDKF